MPNFWFAHYNVKVAVFWSRKFGFIAIRSTEPPRSTVLEEAKHGCSGRRFPLCQGLQRVFCRRKRFWADCCLRQVACTELFRPWDQELSLFGSNVRDLLGNLYFPWRLLLLENHNINATRSSDRKWSRIFAYAIDASKVIHSVHAPWFIVGIRTSWINSESPEIDNLRQLHLIAI